MESAGGSGDFVATNLCIFIFAPRFEGFYCRHWPGVMGCYAKVKELHFLSKTGRHGFSTAMPMEFPLGFPWFGAGLHFFVVSTQHGLNTAR